MLYIKNILLISFFCLSVSAFCQTKVLPTQGAAFCGKVGESGPPPQGHYSVDELISCDFTIVPLDTNLTVTEFRLSMVSNDKSYRYFEKVIKGNRIPEMYRKDILTHTSMVMLEFIQVVDKKKQVFQLRPIAIRIK